MTAADESLPQIPGYEVEAVLGRNHLMPRDSGVMLYNLACHSGLSGRTDEALRLLRNPSLVFPVLIMPVALYALFAVVILTAFPDIHFDLEYIVIGPQGVCEEARDTATHQARWLEHEPTGERLEWRNAIFFPWDPGAKRFKGEMVYTDLAFPTA